MKWVLLLEPLVKALVARVARAVTRKRKPRSSQPGGDVPEAPTDVDADKVVKIRIKKGRED